MVLVVNILAVFAGISSPQWISSTTMSLLACYSMILQEGVTMMFGHRVFHDHNIKKHKLFLPL